MRASTGGQIDEVGHWAQRKLELLSDYLHPYTTIMKGQKWCKGYHYVDAFAGSGRPKLREVQRFIDGSPRIALNVQHPFTSYTFIEQEPRRVAQLHALAAEYPAATILVRQADCNDVLANEVAPSITFASHQRAVVFLDPFTMNLDWATIAALAATGAIEIFMNVPTMAVNRGVLYNDTTKVTPEKVERMDRFWGSGDWQEAIYEDVTNLFGEVIERKVSPTTAKRLGTLYCDRLRTVFPFVSDMAVMKNTTGQPIYCLVFAGHNKTGNKIATELVRKMGA